jgi:hypothetical protein
MFEQDTCVPRQTARQRDRSRCLALERKRRQRAKQRQNGAVRIELSIPKSSLEILAWTGKCTGGNAKEQAEYLLYCTVATYKQQTQDLAKQAGTLWQAAQPFLPYTKFLSEPGLEYRIHNRILRSDDWLPLQQQLTALHGRLSKRGWSKQRITAFFKRAAASLG